MLNAEFRNGLLLGLVSGLIGSVLLFLIRAVPGPSAIREFDLLYVVTFGLSFGFGLALYLRARYALATWKLAVLGILMPGLYYIAVNVAAMSYGYITILDDMVVPGLVGGIVGGILASGLVAALLRLGNWRKVVGLVGLVGGVLGPLFLMVDEFLPATEGEPEHNPLTMLILHIPWHAGVLAMLLVGVQEGLGRGMARE